jgi:hypothetical protein
MTRMSWGTVGLMKRAGVQRQIINCVCEIVLYLSESWFTHLWRGDLGGKWNIVCKAAARAGREVISRGPSSSLCRVGMPRTRQCSAVDAWGVLEPLGALFESGITAIAVLCWALGVAAGGASNGNIGRKVYVSDCLLDLTQTWGSVMMHECST